MQPARPFREQFEANATDFVVRPIFPGRAVALYPAYGWPARGIGHRRRIAAFAISLIAFASVLGPVTARAASRTDTVQRRASRLDDGRMRRPLPPSTREERPTVGNSLVLTVLLFLVALVDSVSKSILKARDPTAQKLVVLTGAVGGTFTPHGRAGLFLGPVVLWIFYKLTVAWARVAAASQTASGAH